MEADADAEAEVDGEGDRELALPASAPALAEELALAEARLVGALLRVDVGEMKVPTALGERAALAEPFAEPEAAALEEVCAEAAAESDALAVGATVSLASELALPDAEAALEE